MPHLRPRQRRQLVFDELGLSWACAQIARESSLDRSAALSHFDYRLGRALPEFTFVRQMRKNKRHSWAIRARVLRLLCERTGPVSNGEAVPQKISLAKAAVVLAVLASSLAVSSPAAADPAARALTDRYLFHSTIYEFWAAKRVQEHGDVLDWTDDGCSVPQAWANGPGGFNFLPACMRHDFGYRNYKRMGIRTPENRLLIDRQFKKDMYDECAKSRGKWAWRGAECRRYANRYYAAVRRWG